jgi:hypothetical protein
VIELDLVQRTGCTASSPDCREPVPDVVGPARERRRRAVEPRTEGLQLDSVQCTQCLTEVGEQAPDTVTVQHARLGRPSFDPLEGAHQPVAVGRGADERRYRHAGRRREVESAMRRSPLRLEA